MSLNLDDLEAAQARLRGIVRQKRRGYTPIEWVGCEDVAAVLEALGSTVAKLREAEAVIETARALVEPPQPLELGKSMMRSFDRLIGDLRHTLATYKPTNQEESTGR